MRETEGTSSNQMNCTVQMFQAAGILAAVSIHAHAARESETTKENISILQIKCTHTQTHCNWIEIAICLSVGIRIYLSERAIVITWK